MRWGRLEWAGQPFEGMGSIGYDNLRQEYVSIWMDNMSTGMMQMTGTFDSASPTLKTTGQLSCPLSGDKNRWVRSEAKIIDRNENIYTSYFRDADGTEFKAMEIIYKRDQ